MYNPYEPPKTAPPRKHQDAEERRSLPNAPRRKRLLAALLDSALLILCYLATTSIWKPFTQGREELAPLYVLAGATPIYLLQWVLITLRGQTPGKMLVGIRIVRDDGSELGFVRGVVLRSMVFMALHQLKPIPVIGVLASLLMLADVVWIFGTEHRCLHDVVAGTRVVNA